MAGRCYFVIGQPLWKEDVDKLVKKWEEDQIDCKNLCVFKTIEAGAQQIVGYHLDKTVQRPTTPNFQEWKYIKNIIEEEFNALINQTYQDPTLEKVFDPFHGLTRKEYLINVDTEKVHFSKWLHGLNHLEIL